MGQFKPMVKMETTEPSVILKLAKGGAVKMKKGGSTTKAKKMAMGGGAMEMMAGTPALVGRPAVNAPVRAPGKPSMAMRRKAMMPKKPMMAPPVAPPMKKGGMAEGGESKGMHKAEMKAIKGVDSKLSKHASMAASKGHKGLKTGGVTDGQGGYATGGVANANGGGYKRGGKTKKMADGGGLLNLIGYDPENPDMPYPGFPGGRGGGGGGGDATAGLDTVNQGASTIGGALKNIASSVGGGGGGGKPSPFIPMMQKRGGKVSKKAYAAGGTVNSGRHVAMPQGSKKPSPPVSTNRVSGTFKSGGTVKMNHGGSSDKGEDMSKGAYDKAPKYSRDLEDAFNPLGMVKELAGKAKDFFMPKKTADSVTKTKESVTVTPAGKKRGGRAC